MPSTVNLVTSPRRFSLILLVFTANLFLAGCSAQSNPPEFDSNRAFSLLQKQCDFGPRPVGAEAHHRTKDFLVGELRRHARPERVEIQSFRHVLDGEDRQLWNIIARFGEPGVPGILLCAHWDTRPTADEELEEADRKKPILGANDGASGVAVLLELARMFHRHPPSMPVTIVLFDGEDFGPTPEDMFLGSRHFAAEMGEKPSFKYGILLDMVGDKELDLYREGNSQSAAKQVVDKIWGAARRFGYDAFKDQVKYTIMDDHLPLIEAGIPCVDIIDFDYAYWHTLDDTVDKCSAESLRVVGETIAQVVYSEKP